MFLGIIFWYTFLFLRFLFFWLAFLLPVIVSVSIFHFFSKNRYQFLSSFWFLGVVYVCILLFHASVIYSPVVEEKDCDSLIRAVVGDWFTKENCLNDLKAEEYRNQYDEIIQQGDPSRCLETYNSDNCYNDMWACEKVLNDHMRSKCYLDKSYRDNDISLCEKTLQGEEIDCYINLAVRNLDIKICENISSKDSSEKMRCEYMTMYEKLSKGWTLEDCDFFSDETALWRDLIPGCYAYVWACEKKEVIDANLRDVCYWNLKQCDKIVDRWTKEACLEGAFFWF